MRVDLLSPARLSARPRLAALVGGALERVQGDLRAVHEQALAPAAVRGRGVIVDHEAQDGALLPLALLSLRLPTEQAPVPLADAVVHLTPHGLALFVLTVDVADLAELRRVEDALCDVVDTAAAELAGDLRRVLQGAGALVEEEQGTRDLPQDSFLWWHRVLHDPDDDALAATDLWRYDDELLRQASAVRVGDGYTALRSDDARETAQVLHGLLAATQVWLVSDRLERRLVEQAAALGRAGEMSEGELVAQQSFALRTCEDAVLEGRLLLENQRYSAGPRRQALDAAARSWRMSLDLDAVFSAAHSLRDLVDRRVQERRELQARRLNALVTALAVVSSLSVVLALFETVVGDEVDGLVAVRVLVAACFALGSASAAVVLLRRH